MVFDEKKDVKIAQHEVFITENSKFIASVHRYDEGEVKLQLVRAYQDKSGTWQFGKLGRLNKDEILLLVRLINLVKEHFNITEYIGAL